MRFLSGIAAISLLWEARGASLSSQSYPLDGDESFPQSPPRREPLRRGELEGRNDEIAHEMQTLSIEFSSHRGGSFGSDRSPVMSRFPLPADQARSFKAGEPVELKVNKITSTSTLFPLDPYQLPFCQVEGGPKLDEHQNLGNFLAGDRIKTSPYRLRMLEDMYCEQLCISNFGREEQRGYSPNRTTRAIRNKYNQNWLIDGLPAAMRLEDDTTITTRYTGGFPIGFLAPDTKKSYLYNHVNIEVHYRMAEPGRYQIVRFYVEPFSIKHEFDIYSEHFHVVDIQNPIRSCSPDKKKEHTNYKMPYDWGREPQPASGLVLFTYDVTWIENESDEWANRWDIYLTMGNAIPNWIHWFSIWNSLFKLVMFSAIILTILFGNLRRTVNKQIQSDEEKAERIIQFGWQLLYKEVFLPPKSPSFLAACCGTGAQLLSSFVCAMLLPATGVVHPSNHGNLIVALLVSYALNGLVGGYVTTRISSLFSVGNPGAQKTATKYTAFAFPGIVCGFWLLVQIVSFSVGSTFAYANPMPLFLICTSAPLVYLGAYIGNKQSPIALPRSTRGIPRKVPPQSVFWRVFSVIGPGLITFGTIYVEFYFVHGAIWAGNYYCSFGFLLLVTSLLTLNVGLISILINYSQLCREDHCWWWPSFVTGGSCGVISFLYAFRCASKQDMYLFETLLLYFGCMWVASLALSLMMGAVGVSACLLFNKTMYASIIARSASSFPEDEPIVETRESNAASGHDGSRSANKKALLVLCAVIVLFSPALFHPSLNTDIVSSGWSVRETRGHESYVNVDGVSVSLTHFTMTSDTKTKRTYKAYHVGMSQSLFAVGRKVFADPMIGRVIYFVGVAIATSIVGLSVVLKRRSARPGGTIYFYNQRAVCKIMNQRKRQLRDILSDPTLLQDMKLRFGDLTGLLRIVEEWRMVGFQEKKDECVKLWKKIVIVPWIRNMNICLCGLVFAVHFSGIDPMIMFLILSLVLVHLIDNMLLYKAAVAKGAPKIAESEGILVAVGIPVIEVI